ncbi:hypothetical protein BGP82_12530 [Pseudomonas putida]|uniref:Uncharacterized protein n=1 Tax=Pseudomonas putida TaxID=303 RepID=A0A2S3X0Z0_PSEPU|nr:hypothetical protein BGP81_17605 [Pseudomonas putida]POG07396.1 hypothetical protein BGP82_12530 [Pseudomonas putida]
MGSVSWRRGNRLIITAAQVYAQRRVADGRKWVFALKVFGACEIERRPRGASRATLAPTSAFLGNLRADALVHDLILRRTNQGGRAHLSQALLARNKRRSERSSRCAARAALDFTETKHLKANTQQPLPMKHMDTNQSPYRFSLD